MRKLFIFLLIGFIVAGLVVTGASWLGPGNEPNRLGDGENFLVTSSGREGHSCSCRLCHESHGGGSGLLKEHPTPKLYPLGCFDCHLPHPLVDEPECFSCHECGANHADLPLQDDCFDCHGTHNPNGAPDLSTEEDRFLCH